MRKYMDDREREALAKLIAQATDGGLEVDDLETDVNEAKQDEATEIINQGLAAAVEYLVEVKGAHDTELVIKHWVSENQRKAAERAARFEDLTPKGDHERQQQEVPSQRHGAGV